MVLLSARRERVPQLTCERDRSDRRASASPAEDLVDVVGSVRSLAEPIDEVLGDLDSALGFP